MRKQYRSSHGTLAKIPSTDWHVTGFLRSRGPKRSVVETILGEAYLARRWNSGRDGRPWAAAFERGAALIGSLEIGGKRF